MAQRSRAFWQVIVLAAAASAFLWLLWLVRGVLSPFVAAIFLVYLTEPLLVRMERRQVPRVVAILVVYAMLLGLGWVAVVYLWPTATYEAEKVLAVLPAKAAQARAFAQGLVAMGKNRRLPSFVTAALTSAAGEVERVAAGLASRLVSLTLSVFSHLALLLLAPVISFYLSKDLPRLRRAVLRLFPPSGRREARELLSQVNKVLGSYVRGQLVVSSVVGLATWLGLRLLGVPYALLFGLLAGVFDVIPYFGPVISAVPALALALAHSPWTAGYALLLFLAIHQLEGAILVPRIMGVEVGLHPVLVIFVLLAGGELFGFAGMILGVPVAAVLRVVFQYGFRRLFPDRPEELAGEGGGVSGQAEKSRQEPLPEPQAR